MQPLASSAAGLLKAFRGHLGELLRHPAGTHVVDDLWAGESGGLSGSWAGKAWQAAALPTPPTSCVWPDVT